MLIDAAKSIWTTDTFVKTSIYNLKFKIKILKFMDLQKVLE